MIFIGIDDTDTLETQGTNQLARVLVKRLNLSSAIVVRHQLLVHPRVPYTSHNGSASILANGSIPGSMEEFIHGLRHGVQSWFVAGSDPGLCVAKSVPDAVIAFGRRCQQQVVTQQEARELAGRHGVHLEGLGGTEGGVIGALAAVGLAASGNDGRVVHLAAWPWPDELAGPQHLETIRARGIDEVRRADTHEPVTYGLVDVGKRLRPNRRGGRIVLFVTPCSDLSPASARWQAVRLD
jgi:hypothetical protein